MEMKTQKKMIIQRFSSVRNSVDICFDYKGPIIFAETEPIWNAYKEMKDRGVKIRFITEIRKDSINYCQRLFELR